VQFDKGKRIRRGRGDRGGVQRGKGERNDEDGGVHLSHGPPVILAGKVSGPTVIRRGYGDQTRNAPAIKGPAVGKVPAIVKGPAIMRGPAVVKGPAVRGPALRGPGLRGLRLLDESHQAASTGSPVLIAAARLVPSPRATPSLDEQDEEVRAAPSLDE